MSVMVHALVIKFIKSDCNMFAISTKHGLEIWIFRIYLNISTFKYKTI